MSQQASYTIGFSNLQDSSPFCAMVKNSLEVAVAEYPNLTLISRDNDLNDDLALANAQEFAELRVNLAIIFHINQLTGDQIYQILTVGKRIPIIAIDIPILWTTYFGVDNKQAGALAGAALGKWINANWAGQVDKILALTESRVADVVRLRIDHALATLKGMIHYDPNNLLYVDSGNVHDLSVERTIEVLQRWTDYHRIALIGFNEDTSLALMDAVRALGRLDDVVTVGQGADRAALDELRRPDTRLIATTGYRPYAYGAHLVDLAQRILRGERVPANNYVELDLFTPANVPT
jgi:ABC-type sugar transport system substrate-binding protein